MLWLIASLKFRFTPCIYTCILNSTYLNETIQRNKLLSLQVYKAHICTYALINLFINFIPKAGRWTLFSLLKDFKKYIDFYPMQDEHSVRLFEDLANQFVRECIFLLAEFVGGGITPNEVLENIFNTFGGEVWRNFHHKKMSHDDVLIPKIRHHGVLYIL